MTATIKQLESLPENYPAVPHPAVANSLDRSMIWQRLEAYIGYRWSERAVTWIAEGPGEWEPPLSPAVIETFEVWSRAGEWESTTLTASPCGGYYLPATGPYRFTGIVGDDDSDIPATIMQAYALLAEYMAQKAAKAGASSESVAAGSITLSHRRSASWMAEAMQNSGAADLLRPYRRVA